MPVEFVADAVAQLDELGLLAGPSFEAFYQKKTEAYRAGPHRAITYPKSYPASGADLRDYLNVAMDSHNGAGRSGRVAGIIAPHLDYPRGLPCYGGAYAELRERLVRGDSPPEQVVVLGTNHFGRSSSVVATTQSFETPWGVLENDRDFISTLAAESGGDLFPYELDHGAEHSIELQLAWVHHLLGDAVSVAPFLCPQPLGPHGTAPGDPGCVDLREFALALGELVRREEGSTLIIASADLSHVGSYFGGDRELDSHYLAEVAAADAEALQFVSRGDAEGFRACVDARDNNTNICSVGCIYALLTALGGQAEPHQIRYHQAANPEEGNCVTGAAYVFSD